MIRRKLRINIFLALALLLLFGCAGNFTTNVYKGLAVSKATYDNGLSMAGDLYKQGKMSETDKANIIKYGNTYMLLHNQVVVSLLDYQATESAEAKDKTTTYLAQASAALSKLLDIIQPYITGGK